MRLIEQFHRLADGLPATSTLPLADAAERLCCGERNARLLLQRMQAEGWLRWSPGLGRGRPSTLTLLRDPALLRVHQLSRLLEEGKLEAAFSGLPPAARDRLKDALPGFLGARPGGGLRIPFYRPLHALDPVHITRRTEAHLIAQVCDGLTAYDRQREAIVPALAHHWQGDAGGRRWRLWLRPGLRFHDGRPLRAEDAAASLLRVRDTPGPHRTLLAHLARIDTHGLRLDLQLNAPDHLLLHRLAHHATVVLPAGDEHRPDLATRPIGAGAFKLVRNNEHRATFRAFDGYWRERPLLEEIDLWVVPLDRPLPEVHVRLGGRAMAPEPNGPTQRWRRLQQAEPGCDFVLANPACPAFATAARRRALGDWLRAQVSAPGSGVLGASHTTARGWLPGWQHLPAPSRRAPPPTALPKTLRLVTYELSTHIELAQAVARACATQGCEVKITALPFPVFAQQRWLAHGSDGPDGADLMVAGEVLTDDLAFGQFNTLQGDALFHGWLAPGLKRWLAARCRTIAAEADPAARAAAVEAAFARLAEEGAVLPMRHVTQSLDHAPQVGGVALARCGWMDFRSLWVDEADGH